MNGRIHQKALMILDGLRLLPTPPEPVRRVLAMRGRGKAEVDLVSSLMSADPAASAELLRIANSSYFGVPRRVGNVKTALEILGPECFANVALMQWVVHILPPKPGAKAVLDRREFWRHALMTAAVAKFFAGASSSAPLAPERAFAAGLLHDLGKLVLEVFAPDEYGPVIEKRRAEPQTELWMHERLELGLTHAYVSSVLLGRWEIDPEVRDCVEWHHAPARAEEEGKSSASAALVHYCDYLAHRSHTALNVPVPLVEEGAAELAGIPGGEEEHLERVRAELVGVTALFRDIVGE